MRLIARLTPVSAEGTSIPIQYNHLVQAMIYASWNDEMASFIHDHGFLLEKRAFRFFTFSRLAGPYQREGDRLRFTGPVTLQVASPIQALLEELAASMLQKGTVRLGPSDLRVESVELRPTPEVIAPVTVRCLSPVTVYQTLYDQQGRAKTYYYAPTEREFAAQCSANAQRKLRAFGGTLAEDAVLTVEPVGIRAHHQAIVKYKETVIKGWSGWFRLGGSPELIRLVLDAGLGAKNSQGFGMLDLAKEVGR